MTKDIDYSGTKGVLDEYEEIVAKEGFSDSDGVSCGQLMLEGVDTTDDSTEDLKPVDILSPMTVDGFIDMLDVKEYMSVLFLDILHFISHTNSTIKVYGTSIVFTDWVDTSTTLYAINLFKNVNGFICSTLEEYINLFRNSLNGIDDATLLYLSVYCKVQRDTIVSKQSNRLENNVLEIKFDFSKRIISIAEPSGIAGFDYTVKGFAI